MALQCPLEALEWFHPNLNRHEAQAVLTANGVEGSYLVRKSSTPHNYALSVRAQTSVLNFAIIWNGTTNTIEFGLAKFKSFDEFKKHFKDQPLVAGENGVLVTLKYPYLNAIDELDVYDLVRVHCSLGRECSTTQHHTSLTSKEGYLTKMGNVIKSWKTRWFSLQKNKMCYFKKRADKQPVRCLDLEECMSCEYSHDYGKENCFVLVFPWRKFPMYASTKEEADSWVELINFKLRTFQTKSSR